MPRIIESDEESDTNTEKASTTSGNRENEEQEETRPRKFKQVVSRKNVPSIVASTPPNLSNDADKTGTITSKPTKSTANNKKRKAIEFDEDESESAHLDSDEESYGSPAPKRRKLSENDIPKPTLKKPKAAASSSNRKAKKQIVSDDEEEFTDSEASQSYGSYTDSDMDVDSEYSGSEKKSKAKTNKSKTSQRTTRTKAKTVVPASAKKGTPKSKPVYEEESEESVISEEEEQMESDYEDYLTDDAIITEDEEITESEITNTKQRMTARQKAMAGEMTPEHFELTGTKMLTQSVYVEPRLRPAPVKESPKPRIERINPPDDVMAEVNQIVGQLLTRTLPPPAVIKNIKEEPMFNPDMLKYWSRPDGTFITVPLPEFPTLFPSEDGWTTDPPVRSQDNKNAEFVILKRGVLDPA